MDLNQLRALAGIPMQHGQKKTVVAEAKTYAPVKTDGHFDITVPESAVGKVAIALAKEGLPVDITYDGMENFFFNFKSSELKDKAAELAKSFIKEESDPAYNGNDTEYYSLPDDGNVVVMYDPEFDIWRAIANDKNGEVIDHEDFDGNTEESKKKAHDWAVKQGGTKAG